MHTLNPSSLTPQQMKPVGDASTGPAAVINSDMVNYNENPTSFSDPRILIRKDAYAGTKSGCVAARGQFKPYKGGNKISTNGKMKGGNMLTTAPDNCNTPAGAERHATGCSASSNAGSPAPRPHHPVKGPHHKGGKRRRTMKKRKMARKHKRHSKRHHKRSRKMHKKRGNKTRRHHKRAHKKMTRRHKRHSRRHRMRGGKPQPFSNIPMSFGYSLNSTRLAPSMSALANPIPIKVYDNCGKVPRS